VLKNMKLHDLKPNVGSVSKGKRVGRGHGSGSGKTSGRGTKGQGARSGGVKGPYFEGGQLPLVRRLPFIRGVGFSNIWRYEFTPVNFYQIESKFSSNETVSFDSLVAARVIKKSSELIAILSEGEITKPLHFKAHRISKAARVKIEESGGTYEILAKPSRKVIGRGYKKK